MATFDLRSSYKSVNLDRDLQGTIKIEVPLTSRHVVDVVYGLKERQNVTTGHCVIVSDDRKILNGQYTCKSESRAGYSKDVVDITIENEKKPIGIAYVHVYEYGGAEDEPQYVRFFNLPTKNVAIIFLYLISGYETCRNL